MNQPSRAGRSEPRRRELDPPMKPSPSPTLGEKKDADLMVLVQQGDRDAFRELYDRHQRGVFGFVYRMVPDIQHTESIVQDAFLRLIRNAASYRYPEHFTTWFYTIA